MSVRFLIPGACGPKLNDDLLHPQFFPPIDYISGLETRNISLQSRITISSPYIPH